MNAKKKTPDTIPCLIKDRFGKPVRAREWFLIPIFVIDEFVELLKQGSLNDYYYDPKSAKLKKV